jgi:cobalamin 5'-phosphate synthase/cobalamin synthase
VLAAISFLTRIPVPGAAEFSATDVARAAGWFPLVGMLLGGIYSLAAILLKDHLPLAVVAVLLVALDALFTGALHFDGLADTADGFGGGKNIEDILRIMRDHLIGSYGGVALALVVAMKVTAYAALLDRSHWIPAVILTPALGRWSILLLTGILPYARPTPSAIQGMGKRSLFLGTVSILAVIIAEMSPQPWIAMGAVIVMSAVFGLYCKHKIAGITGDTLGASVQLCETVSLLAFLWRWQ